jgi:ATP synthase protein I
MDATPAVERDIAIDMVKRGLVVSPVVVLVAGLLRGWDGAASAAIALAIVFANFLAAASIVSWAGTISTKAAGIAATVGYVVRLAVIVLVLFLFKNASWIDFPTLGITLVAAHVGLLTWEAKHVTLSLASPGLRPARSDLSRPAAISGDE